MVTLLFFEAAALAAFGLAQGDAPLHVAAHVVLLVPVAFGALLLEQRRRAASVLVSIGLMTGCALLVHTWHGAIEAHFLFFVTIVLLALYEDWIPFLVAAAYVVLHHGVAGAIEPSAVYNHPDAIAHPWKWAAIHGAFVVAAGLASVAAWRLNEQLRAELHESYRHALESEERFRGAFDDAPIGMVLFTFHGPETENVMRVNHAMCEITGYTREEICRQDFRVALHPDDAERTTEAMGRLVAGETEHERLELRYIHAKGHTVWIVATISLLRQGSGHAIAQVQDITQHRLVAEELIHQALHDPLTGLGNRRSLIADLELGLIEATTARPLVLALLDIDGFKAYNDAHGLDAGDLLLTQVAGRLEAAVGGCATVYRAGPDEFCLLSDTASGDRKALLALAREALAAPSEHGPVKATCGAVSLPAEAATATEALSLADRRVAAGQSTSAPIDLRAFQASRRPS
jgi:PAS domain S-box-containing protein/diguanylate cyclase (GGDEF)-like protein